MFPLPGSDKNVQRRNVQRRTGMSKPTSDRNVQPTKRDRKGFFYLTNLTTLPDSTVVSRVTGYASLRADAAQIAALRKAPGSVAGKPVLASFLKNADDQTVTALAALLRALADRGWQERSFRTWGVVAAPNLFGRFSAAQGLHRFLLDGPWGISPHTIPHHSLHAVSGTLSMALQIHGPNFGISGGANAAAEAFLVAATLMAENTLPGLWVVLSGAEPEYIPVEGGDGAPTTPTTCLAAVLALEPLDSTEPGPRMRVATSEEIVGLDGLDFTLEPFVACLEERGLSGRWWLPGGGVVDFADQLGEVPK